MYFDALTAAAVGDELRALLRGGRVQDTVQADAHSVGLEIYAGRQRQYLLLSANPQNPRAHLVTGRLRRGVERPSQLELLLRRYVEGTRLRAVSVPQWERVLHLDFEGPEGAVRLIVEAIARRGNVLLVGENGVILDCLRRVGPQENRVRLSLPGHVYVPPPPQHKRDPLDLTPLLIEDALLSDPGAPTWRALVKKVLGFSPLLAREVVFQATGAAETRAAETSARALQEVIETILMPLWERDWQPCVVDAEDGDVLAFAPYRLTHLGKARPVESISRAVEEFYGAPVGVSAYQAAKEPVRAAIAEAQARVRRKLEALRRSRQGQAEIERLRRCGELTLAYQYTLKPNQDVFSAPYEVDGPEIAVELDPSLTPVENAQRYFERYEKAKRAEAEVPALIEAAERELVFLDQLALDVELAGNWPEIEEVRAVLEEHGYWRGGRRARPRGGKTKPLRVTTDDGFVIWVGRNARQNDRVTFERGGPEDLWLHVRGAPGAHVIVKNDGRPVPETVIRQAATLAARYSALRAEARVLVDVTQRKYVRRVKGGKPGIVTYRNEEPVEVAPAEGRAG
jgi:predicted ribosome quality control (RQC) complex YloA/Tae2 family protein